MVILAARTRDGLMVISPTSTTSSTTSVGEGFVIKTRETILYRGKQQQCNNSCGLKRALV